MDRCEIKKYLEEIGYRELSGNRFRNICNIYYRHINCTDEFVLFFDNTTVAGKNNIYSINEAIRNKDDFYDGCSNEKVFLNIVKVDDKNEKGAFIGKDIIVTCPDKDMYGSISSEFEEVMNEIKRSNKIKDLAEKKYKIVAGTLGEKTRLPIVTAAFILICIYCYVRYFREAQYWAISPEALQKGMFLKTISAMFMHGSIAHIVLNMFALFSYGKALENREGHIAMFIAYMLSGVTSMFVTGFTSLVLGNMNTSTVGASGAIYGIIGSYIVSELFLPKGLKNPKKLITGTLYMIIMSAFIPGVDNVCHVAGLIAGMITMLIIKFIKRATNEIKYSAYSNKLAAHNKDFIIPGKIKW